MVTGGYMDTFKLKLSMLGTLALIIGLTTLFGTIILRLIGVTSLTALLVFVFVINFAQWLLAPYIIDLMYRVRELGPAEAPELHEIMERLSVKSGIKKPRLMISKIGIPNAFAYGSPLTGYRVAVTEGLLGKLEHEEIEAVLGHEIGHLRHRDAQLMMFVSVLPAIFYYIGLSLMYSGMYSGYYSDREGEGSSAAMVIGIIAYAFYWILTLFILYLSRLREYYADRHSVKVVPDGARKLSEALAKIVYSTSKITASFRKGRETYAFKTLFISDPDTSIRDSKYLRGASKGYGEDQLLVQKLMRKRLTWLDYLTEILSTHPNIVKRLKALQKP